MLSTRVRVLQTPPRTRVNSVSFSPDGKTVVLAVQQFGSRGRGTSTLRGQAQVWDVASATWRQSYDCQNSTFGYIDHARFSVDSKWLSVGSEICNLQTGKRFTPFQDGDSNHEGLLFSPDKQTIAAPSKNALALWSFHEKRPHTILGDTNAIDDRLNHAALVPFISTAAFSPDGLTIVTGNTKGEILLWDVNQKKLSRTLGPVGTLGARGAGVHRVAFSSDGHTIAATDGGEIILWDARDGNEIARWNGPSDVSMFGLAFSPDGKVLASGGPNFSTRRLKFLNILQPSQRRGDTQGEVDLWEVPRGRLKSTLRDGKWIINIAFSPDGQFIATSGDDNTARLWDMPH